MRRASPRRLVAKLPPDEQPADLRAAYEGHLLVYGALRAFTAPAADVGSPVLAQAAVDMFHGQLLLERAPVARATFSGGEPSALWAAAGMAPGAAVAFSAASLCQPAAPLEITLMRCALLYNIAWPPGLGDYAAMASLLRNVANFWAAPGRAEASAARLAALGVRGAAAAAGDVCFFMLRACGANFAELGRREDAAAAIAEALVVRPEALRSAIDLGGLWPGFDARRARAVAVRGLGVARRAGHDCAAAELALLAATAIEAGALGGDTYLAGDVKSLIADVRRSLDAARRVAPHALHATLDAACAGKEADLGQFADDTSLLVRRTEELQSLEHCSRRCARCDAEAAEMKLCSRCRGAFYCSRPCQQAHWPEHKHACKAARGGAAAAGR
jgi:hypothetical protein